MNSPRLILAMTLALTCALSMQVNAAPKSSAAKAGPQLYRYVNNQGTTVTSSHIPPEYARKGYKIVTMSGQVIEDVPAEMSEEDKKKIDANRLSETKQREKDKLMLLKYSNVSELIQARDRRLSELDNKIKSLEASALTTQQHINSEQQRAANFERSGREVAPATLKKLEDLYKDQQIAQEQVKAMKAAHASESKQFEEDIARYEYLRNQKLKRDALEAQ